MWLTRAISRPARTWLLCSRGVCSAEIASRRGQDAADLQAALAATPAGPWIDNDVKHFEGPALPVTDPTTGGEICALHDSQAAVQVAVSSAGAAFPSWRALPPADRAATLRSIAQGIRKHAKWFQLLDALSGGKPIVEAEWDAEDAAGCFEYMASLAEELPTLPRPVSLPTQDYTAAIAQEPVGVVAAITPWNYPLLMAVWKVAPALAAGCPVVLKPSEYTPLSALLLAKVAAEAGLPRGVLNVVPGRGETVGAALAASGGVAKVTFTGSTRAGAAVAATAAATAKAVSLELGGKSSAVVFEDAVRGEAALTRVVEWLSYGVAGNNGQICSATSRLLVQDSVWDVLVPRLAEALASLPMGDPLDPSTRLGPLANAVQHAGVSGFIRRAREAGLPEITCSAKQALPEGGFFVRPAVFGPVPSDAEVWQSEVFGPVLCAQRFTSESQAMEAANNTPYGLAAAVFTERQDVWERCRDGLRAGTVWRNCSQPAFVQLPWGGFGASGTGRDLGPAALQQYLLPKTLLEAGPGLSLGWHPGLER